MPKKKWSICVDFDGVIHQYTSPFRKDHLDPPMPGAFDWLRKMVKDFHVIIASSRITPHYPDECNSHQALLAEKEAEESLTTVTRWFLEEGLESATLDQLEFWTDPGKPTALIYIDDRGFRFEGHFPTKGEIHRLRPWKYSD